MLNSVNCSEMTTKEKRKHVTLTVAQKLELLELLEIGTSASKLAKLYGVGKSTITDIKKNKEKLRRFALSNKRNPAKRHTLKKAANPAFEDALKAWFLQEQMLGTPISSTFLAEKARSLYKEMTGKDDFMASRGWLHRFKTDFRYSTEVEETMCDNSYLLQQHCVHFWKKIEEMGLCPDQVYSAAHSQTFWQMLPINISVVTDIRETHEKQLTFMPCANALGTHKIRLLLIERIENPISFKDVDLPFCYTSEENGELTSEIIRYWFDTEFVPSVRQYLKSQGLAERALLVLNNIPGDLILELTSDDGQITTLFLPSDVAPSLQPMQQKIIQIMKTYYCKKLLLMADKCDNLQLAIKSITLTNATYWFSEAWEVVSGNMINQSWRQLWPNVVSNCNANGSESEPIEVRNMLNIFWNKNCNKKTMDPPESIEITPNTLIDGGLVECILKEEPEYESKHDCDIKPNISDLEVAEDCEFKPSISHVEAADYFSKCLQWAEENGASLIEKTTLKQLQLRAIDMIGSS